MATFDQLIDDVRGHMHAYLEDEEQYATLASPIGAGDLTITVDEATHIDQGAIEIDDEIILIKEVDKLTSTLSVRKRGHLSTTAASHAQDALIRAQPIVPRQKIKDAINETLAATFPTLFQVKVAPMIPYVAAKQMYELPADVEEMLALKYSVPGVTAWWQPAAAWEFDAHANQNATYSPLFASGKAFWLGDTPVPGQGLQVIYIAPPGVLTAGSDTLETTAGMPASVRDLIGFGAVARILPAIEVGRLAHTSIEQSVRDQVVRSQDAITTSRYYMQLYSLRLEEEGAQLQAIHRAQVRQTF